MGFATYAQERPETAQLQDPQSVFWFNSYGKFRVSEKFFWIAQIHYRRSETEEVPFVGRMAQIYNRHAINYQFSKRFNASFGGVLRIDFNPEGEGQPGMDDVVLEPRIWHEYLFAMPFDRFMAYHRFRIEHRWSRGFQEDANYIFRNRYRYSFSLKIPVNRPSLSPGAFYLGPEAEIIMQSGRPVVSSPMEEFRLLTTIGYISSPRVTYATGLMYGLGQGLHDGAYYRQRLILRVHVYISLDFRRVEQRLPDVHISD